MGNRANRESPLTADRLRWRASNSEVLAQIGASRAISGADRRRADDHERQITGSMSQLNPFVIAGIQCDPQIARPDLNLEMIADQAARACNAGAKLAIFPECAVSGYCFDTLEEALEVAEAVSLPAPAAPVAIFGLLALQLGVWWLECAGAEVFNRAVRCWSGGVFGTFRK